MRRTLSLYSSNLPNNIILLVGVNINCLSSLNTSANMFKHTHNARTHTHTHTHTNTDTHTHTHTPVWVFLERLPLPFVGSSPSLTASVFPLFLPILSSFRPFPLHPLIHQFAFIATLHFLSCSFIFLIHLFIIWLFIHGINIFVPAPFLHPLSSLFLMLVSRPVMVIASLLAAW